MKAIRDLLRLGCSQCRAFGVQATPIPRYRYDFRMLFQPLAEALRSPIGKKVHHAVQVQIHQNGSIILALAPCPIIHAQVANGEIGYVLRRLLTDPAQDSVVARADGKSLKQPLARKTTSDVANQPDQFRSSRRLPRVDLRHTWQALTEDLPRACAVGTAKPADGHPQLHGNTLPGKILQAAGIAAMQGSRNLAAERACWVLLYVHHQAKSVLVPLDAVQN